MHTKQSIDRNMHLGWRTESTCVTNNSKIYWGNEPGRYITVVAQWKVSRQPNRSSLMNNDAKHSHILPPHAIVDFLIAPNQP